MLLLLFIDLGVGQGWKRGFGFGVQGKGARLLRQKYGHIGNKGSRKIR